MAFPRINSRSGPKGLFPSGISNVPVYDALLFAEVRLFTKDKPMDSITVGHKLVEDVQCLMDCFRYISKNQAFQQAGSTSLYKKNGAATTGSGNGKAAKKRQREVRSVFQDFPGWFGTKVGYTIYQWLAAYFEHLVTKRYQIMNVDGETALVEKYLDPMKQAFIEHNNVTKFVELMDRKKVPGNI